MFVSRSFKECSWSAPLSTIDIVLILRMQERESLYLWAIVPPAYTGQKIEEQRNEFSINFQCFKALKPPVHITLYTVFKETGDVIAEHLTGFKRAIATQACFTVELKNFNFFEHAKSPVIYINVVPNVYLKHLNTIVSKESRAVFGPESINNNIFRPHVTIGYRDVSPALFPEIKKVYSKRPFRAVFPVNTVVLFRHDENNWKVEHEFALGEKNHGQTTLW